MKPVVIYLDTSDIIALRAAALSRDTDNIYRRLMEFKSKGLAVFPLSFFHFFEFLQAADDRFVSDRYERASFLSDLCSDWSFPYYEDLLDGSSIKLGPHWIPRESLRAFDVEGLLGQLRVRLAEKLKENKLGNRRERKKLTASEGFRNFLIENPAALANGEKQSGNLFYNAIFDSGIIRKFALGKVRREEANEFIRREVLNLAVVYYWYFEEGKNENPITDRLRELKIKWDDRFAKLRSTILQAKRIADDVSELEKGLKRASVEMNEGQRTLLKELKRQKLEAKRFASRPITDPENNILPRAIVTGEQFQSIFVEVLNAVATEKVPFESSLMGDLLHAVYLPFCDLWRGDRSFSNILISSKVPNYQKVVRKLLDLPDAIEKILEQREYCYTSK